MKGSLRLLMAVIPEAVREFLATGPYAHVVTGDHDGPHITFGWGWPTTVPSRPDSAEYR